MKDMESRMRYALLIAFLLAISQLSEGRKTYSSGRKTSGSSSRRRTPTNTQQTAGPSYPKQATNYDAAKLSYSQPSHAQPQPNYASAPKQQPGQTAPIGWNVPKQEAPVGAVNKPPSYASANMGPPPAYSPQNVPGAHVNRHEAPPAYSPNSQAGYPHANPPAYPGVQQSHAAPNYQQGPQTYAHPAGGAAYPQQPMYNQQIPQGQAPVYQGAGVQPGFYPAGATPVLLQTQQKGSSGSGLGFGSGLLAGGLAGGLLGHALTPSRNNDHDRVIVINNSDGNQNGNPAAPAPVAPAAPYDPNMATPYNPNMAAPYNPNMAAPYNPNMTPMAGQTYQPAPPGTIPMVQGADQAVVQQVNGTTLPQENPMQNTQMNPDQSTPLAPMPVMNSNLENPVPLAPFPAADSLTATNHTGTAQTGVMCVPVAETEKNEPNVVKTADSPHHVICYNITQPAGQNKPELVHDKNTPKPLLGTIADRSSAPSLTATFTLLGLLQAVSMLCAYSA